MQNGYKKADASTFLLTEHTHTHTHTHTYFKERKRITAASAQTAKTQAACPPFIMGTLAGAVSDIGKQ